MLSGRRVPEDISLITYEDNSSAYLVPPLTTIEYNYEQLVRKAIEQLKNEIAGKKIIPEIHVPCRLNIRNSTAAPPKKNIRSKNQRHETDYGSGIYVPPYIPWLWQESPRTVP